MNQLFYHGRLAVLAGLFAAFGASAWAAAMPSALTADDIMRKAVSRAEERTSHPSQPEYFYTKHTITEDLDNRGRVKDRKDRLYEVTVADGFSNLKLLQLNGQNVTNAVLKKQAEHEAAERQKITDVKPGQKGDGRENYVTAEMVGRFNFSLASQQVLNGRNTYMLTFEPKRGLAEKKLTDRFINQMAGTVWIDAEDFEIAHAEIHLQSEITLWGGMVGTLRHCRFTLERTRLPDGTWVNSFSHGIFEGRKLLEPMMIRTRSESSNFRHSSLAEQ